MKERDYFITKRERPMYERYDKAVEEGNTEELKWFEMFNKGKWESQMIRNAVEYEQYLRCGYQGQPTFNEYGWLDNGRCAELKKKAEEIQVFMKEQYYAVVMLLQHPNGKWIATTSYMLPQSGGGSYPNIWCTPYPTRREALNAALDSLISRIGSCTAKSDRSFLEEVRKMRCNTAQTSLFGLF